MHANARLAPQGRRMLCERIGAGRPVAHVAAEMGVSRSTAYRWWRRYQEAGEAGLVDRSSRPRSCPHRTPPELELGVLQLRRERKLGPARIGMILGMPSSTVWRVLCRHGLNQLRWMDRPTGRVIRRYERSTPGELVHIDIKKLGRIPDGGGWRALGRDRGLRNSGPYRRRHAGTLRSTLGYGYVHAAVDDHTRLAYVEVLNDEKAVTAVGFLHRAVAWFTDHGIEVQSVMTDIHTGPATAATSSATPSPRWASATYASRPAAPSSTAKSNASIEPCWRNGPTSVPTAQNANALTNSTTGSTPTTITATTPP